MSDGMGEAVALYHDERARFGGVGWEFHARAATVCRERDSMVDRIRELEAEIQSLKARLPPERCPSIDDVGGQCRWSAGHGSCHESSVGDGLLVQCTDATPQHRRK